MDPVSAIGAVASVAQLGQYAFKLGHALYKIVDGAKSVDLNIKQVALETKALGRACDLVNTELVKINTGSDGRSLTTYDPDGQLEICLSAQIEGCQSTLSDLDEVIKSLSTPSQTFLGQVLRQIEFQKRESAITRIRKRIQTHTEALQILLHITSISVAHAAPGYANQELLQHLTKLDLRLRSIEDKLPSLPRDSQINQKSSFGLLQVCAHEALRSGKSLYDASVAGDSVIGAEDAVHNNFKVFDWLQQANRSPGNPIAPPVSEARSDQSVTTSDIGQHIGLKASSLAYELLDATDILYNDENCINDDDDDDDDDLVEAANTGLRSSLEAFEAGNWSKTEDLLRATFESFEQLPRRYRDSLDLFDIQYRLVVCGYYLREPEVAEAGLRSVLAHSAVSDEQRVQMCDAGYLLACLLVKLGRFMDAEVICKSTLKARSRLQGKTHEARFQTLALLSCVYDFLDHAQGEIYASMIPERCRGLHLENARSIKTRQKPPLPVMQNNNSQELSSREIDLQLRSQPPSATTAPIGIPSSLLQGSRSSVCDTSPSPPPAIDTEKRILLESDGTTSLPSLAPQSSRESWTTRVWNSSRKRISRTSTSSINDEEIERKPSNSNSRNPSICSPQSGETPLHAAIRADNFPLVHFLLEYHDADRQLKILNDDGLSPLTVAIHRAADNRQLPLSIVHALLESGADSLQKHIFTSHQSNGSRGGSSISFTPRDVAQHSGRKDLIEELRRYKDRSPGPQAWNPQIIHQ